MPDIDPVILKLQIDAREYRNELKNTTNFFQGQIDRQERAIIDLENAARRGTTNITNVFGNMSSRVGGYLAGIAVGALIKELADLADTSKQIDAQLKLATATFGTFGRAQEDVRRIADDTRGSLEATASLYGNFVRATEQIGGTQAQASRATETFAKALKIGGADANAAASATLQFGQALASGALRGDEFNSIAEASPRILRLIADAMGVTQGAVRSLAEQGKLTSDVLFRALTDRKFTAGIDAEFKQIPVTFGDAMQAMENAAITSFGEFDKGGRFSDAIVAFLGTGTDTFEGLTSKASEFGRETRAVFDGLANVFDPLEANGNAVFDALGIRIYSVREQIGSLLDSLDRFANFGTNIENAFKRGLNRAIDRAGGGQKFQEIPLQNLGGNFRQGARVSDARGRIDAAARRLEASGFIVPRNADGTVNQAGIVRRPPTPARPRPTASAASGGRPRATGSGRSRTTGAATDDALTAAEIIAGIKKDMAAIARDGGVAVLTESEKLDRAARNFRGIVGREGQDYDNPFAGVEDYDRESRQIGEAMEEAERAAQDMRESNVRQLADLYGDLFTRGTDEVWRNFKEQGLRNIALVLAQATVASFTSGGGGFGSLLGNITKAAGGALGGLGGLFGRASGGYVAPGQTVRVNEGTGRTELLRMGGQGGTVIPLGQTRATRQSTPTIVNAPQFNLRGAIITRELYADMERISAQSAIQASRTAYSSAVRDAPVRASRQRPLKG